MTKWGKIEKLNEWEREKEFIIQRMRMIYTQQNLNTWNFYHNQSSGHYSNKRVLGCFLHLMTFFIFVTHVLPCQKGCSFPILDLEPNTSHQCPISSNTNPIEKTVYIRDMYIYLRHCRKISQLFLFVLMSAEIWIQAHAQNGYQYPNDVSLCEGVMQQCIAKAKNKACFQVAKHLICDRRRLPDH